MMIESEIGYPFPPSGLRPAGSMAQIDTLGELGHFEATLQSMRVRTWFGLLDTAAQY